VINRAGALMRQARMVLGSSRHPFLVVSHIIQTSRLQARMQV